MRRLPDKRWIHYPIPQMPAFDTINTVKKDPEGRIWVARRSSVFVFKPDSLDELKNEPNFNSRSFSELQTHKITNSSFFAPPSHTGKLAKLVFAQSEPEQFNVENLYRDSGDKIWISAIRSLFVFDKSRFEQRGSLKFLPGRATSESELDELAVLWKYIMRVL